MARLSTPQPAIAAEADADRRARHFLTAERAFRLGALVTEQSHPATRGLGDTARNDLRSAVAMLQAVDRDLPPGLARALASPAYAALVDAITRAVRAGCRVFFTGCGATGRLSILLEAAWRKHFDTRGEHACAEQARSVMAGGDYALIRSVEGFEDFADFGRHQINQAGLAAGDVVIAMTEGGETPFVIGTAWAGLDAGASVFFVFNNPAEVLAAHVERSRQVIHEPGITKLDLTTGPMAVAGSTRMQATTIELAVVGSALEEAIARFSDQRATPAAVRCARFVALLDALEAPPARDAITELARAEAEVYGGGGRVTYFADDLLLDVLTDTTERSPTFSLPPFRRGDDSVSPVSWSFVKDPARDTAEAWRAMLGRPIRGLDWTAVDYRRMNAPDALIEKPPALGTATIERFMIGREPDPSRTDTHPNLAIMLDCPAPTPAGFDRNGTLRPGSDGLALPLVDSPLQLSRHLAVKLLLNTISTASMAALGRLRGNWMIHVSCSNKKLIDRGTRLLADQLGFSYDDACVELFRSINAIEKLPADVIRPSPVAHALKRVNEGGAG